MNDHIYILPGPVEANAGEEITFVAGQFDMPSEIESLNAFSETINDYFEDPDLFDPFNSEKQIEDVYLYFIFNYLKVLQGYIHRRVTTNDDARFIILHFDYFYGHFAKTVVGNERKIERTLDLITAVFKYFDKNEKIETIGSFENEEAMIEYYIALKNLYYGEPSLYLEVIGKYL